MTARRLGRGTLLWVFGLSVTVFLVSMWGRAIIVDTDTLADTVAPMATSRPVVDIFTDWLAGEMVEAGAGPDLVDDAVTEVLSEPDVSEALDQLLVAVVKAAGVPGPGDSTVDVAALLQPAAPAIARSISGVVGSEVSTAEVGRVIDDLDPIVVRADGVAPVVGSGSPIAGRLGTATVVALLVMVVAGWFAIATSDDRLVAVKGLLTRVSLGALSFAVMLRIGSWILSPTGGRAPISDTFGALFHSKWTLPLIIGLVAGAGVAAAWMIKKLRNGGDQALDQDINRTIDLVSLHSEPVESSVQHRSRG